MQTDKAENKRQTQAEDKERKANIWTKNRKKQIERLKTDR